MDFDSSSSQSSQAYAIGVLMYAVLYGICLATFVQCCYCWWLVYSNRRQKSWKSSDKKLLSITICIFVFLTMSFGVTIQILLDILQNNIRSAPLSIVKTVIENTVILITNAVFIYRCWIVYTNSCPWKIIFIPLFLWISALVCSILIGYLYVHGYVTLLHTTPGPTSLVFSDQVPGSYPYWVVFYVLNIAINVYATCSIIYRINRVARNFMPSSRKLYKICKILAQFGCLYMVTTLLSLISVIPENENGIVYTIRFALNSINLMVPGITFNLVQILAHRERAKAGVNLRKSSQTITTPTSPTPFVHVHEEFVEV